MTYMCTYMTQKLFSNNCSSIIAHRFDGWRLALNLPLLYDHVLLTGKRNRSALATNRALLRYFNIRYYKGDRFITELRIGG